MSELIQSVYALGTSSRRRRPTLPAQHGAGYCQAVNPPERALHRFRKLRNRIRPGTENDRLDYFPRRPKGMRRVTYQRIKAAALAALERYHAALDVKLAGWLAALGLLPAP